MKSKSIFLMVVSLGFGLVAAVGITQVMGKKKAAPTAELKTVPVLIAIEDLDINTELKPEMFSVEQWPAKIAPEDIVSDMAEIENKVVRSRVGKRGPIYLSDLIDISEATKLPIPPGFKVVGIKLGADDHINGLLQPGDLVDVIGVFRGGATRTVPSSRTFLRKLRVFSVAAKTSPEYNRDPSAKGSIVVGLLVTEKQSEQIVLVQKVAEIKLAMRGPHDDEVADNELGASWNDFWPAAEGAPVVSKFLQGLGQAMTQPAQTPVSIQPEPKKDDSKRMVIITADSTAEFKFDENGRKPVRIDKAVGATQPPAAANTPAATSTTPVTPITPPQDVIDVEDFSDKIKEMDSDPLSDRFESDSGD